MKIISSSRQFGNIIKKVRKHYRMTQKELAAASGTGVRFIQDLESGKATCALDKAIMVSKMLGLRLEVQEPKYEAE